MQLLRLTGQRCYSIFHCAVLCGYAFFGRGFAYIGVPPLYIGELSMGWGLLILLATPTKAILLLRELDACTLLLFAGIGAARTLPFIGDYGLIAIRDAVIWIYAAFTPITFVILYKLRNAEETLLRLYTRLAKIYLIALPAIWLVTNFFTDLLPQTPYGEVATVRAEEVLIHLSAIITLMLSTSVSFGWYYRALAGVDTLLYITINRGAMIAFFLVVLLNLVVSLSLKRIVALAGIVTVAVLLMSQLDLFVQLSRKERPVSLDQIKMNILSIFDTNQDQADLQATRRWRVAWWTAIVHYTFYGENFWGGKGFGVNLADDDGFQVMTNHSLRSPHNGHMTILARMGVPGLAAWICFNLIWAVKTAWQAALARIARDQERAATQSVLFAYWLASTVTLAFTVQLEAPMMGIWFWTLIGVGMALRSRPQVRISATLTLEQAGDTVLLRDIAFQHKSR